MARYPTGQPVRITWTVRDIAGALANPGGQSLTLLRPDLTTQVFASPSTTGTGLFFQDIPVSDLVPVGHFQYKAVATGANSGVVSGAFDVFDPFDSEILSVADGKEHLNIPAAITTQDAELEVYIAAVTGAVEGMIGPVGRRTVTEVVFPSSGVLMLSTTPVLSITSITPYAGVALGGGTYTLAPGGIVYPSTYAAGFWGAQSYTVIYVCGRASVPAEVNLAARIILAHLWETQRGPADSAFAAAEEGGFTPGFGFAIPNRAKELLAAYRLAPAVA